MMLRKTWFQLWLGEYAFSIVHYIGDTGPLNAREWPFNQFQVRRLGPKRVALDFKTWGFLFERYS